MSQLAHYWFAEPQGNYQRCQQIPQVLLRLSELPSLPLRCSGLTIPTENALRHVCWKRALLRRPVPDEVGAHAAHGLTRMVLALWGPSHLGGGHDAALLPHLLHQERGQCGAAMEGVEDPSRRRLGGAGESERGGGTEAEEDLSRGRGRYYRRPV